VDARRSLTPVIEPMTLDDLPAVRAIERASFTTPWPDDAYRSELQTNRLATYVVARAGEEVVGFAGLWLMVDEAHITTFAVHPAWRRRRIGERLLVALLDVAIARQAREATLEVRLSNVAARRLYEKYGFRPVGLRPRYYSDDGEDALIMTTEPLAAPDMTARVARLRAALDAPTAVPPDGEAATEAAPDVVPGQPDPATRGAGRASGGPGHGLPGAGEARP
jgi:ribosomal-protein-alanine N-acetyltransferase